MLFVSMPFSFGEEVSYTEALQLVDYQRQGGFDQFLNDSEMQYIRIFANARMPSWIGSMP